MHLRVCSQHTSGCFTSSQSHTAARPDKRHTTLHASSASVQAPTAEPWAHCHSVTLASVSFFSQSSERHNTELPSERKHLQKQKPRDSASAATRCAQYACTKEARGPFCQSNQQIYCQAGASNKIPRPSNPSHALVSETQPSPPISNRETRPGFVTAKQLNTLILSVRE